MNKDLLIKALREQVSLAKNIRLSSLNNPNLGKAKNALKTFQNDRLRQTHEDLLKDPETSSAATFFLNEVYSTKDLTKRDQNLEKLVPIIEKTFPMSTLETLVKAMTLDALTEKLDTEMAIKLGQKFTIEQYDQAFREVGTRDQREQQLEMIEDLGKCLGDLTKIPFLATTLKIMRGPAKLVNLYEMHEFLESGFTVFKNIKDPSKFVQTIVKRENIIMNEIYQPKA